MPPKRKKQADNATGVVEQSKDGPKKAPKKAKGKADIRAFFGGGGGSAKKKATFGPSVKIISWNVNGIRALQKNDALPKMAKDQDPDVIVLTETKLNETDVEQFESLLPGYEAHFNCCTSKKGYSGTAMFTKVPPVSIAMNGICSGSDAAAKSGARAFDEEGRAITIEFEDFYLVNTYVPNSGMKLENLKARTEGWDPAMAAHLRALDAKKPVIWCGDLNVAHGESDVHTPKTNRNKTPGFTDAERANFGALVGGVDVETLPTTMGKSKNPPEQNVPGPDRGGCDFVDVYRLPKFNPYQVPQWFQAQAAEDEDAKTDEKCPFTYWSYRFNAKAKNKGWRLDYFVASKRLEEKIKDTYILPETTGSDHYPIGLVLTR